jgi:hypothetical protein
VVGLLTSQPTHLYASNNSFRTAEWMTKNDIEKQYRKRYSHFNFKENEKKIMDTLHACLHLQHNSLNL